MKKPKRLVRTLSDGFKTGLIDSGPGQSPPAATQPRSRQLSQGRCIPGYVQIRELCINVEPRDATSFPFAHETCRLEQITGRVATYTDYLLVERSVADVFLFNPNGLWLGPDLVGDDQALVGNTDIDHSGDPDVSDFEGVGNKNENRGFRCAYDLYHAMTLCSVADTSVGQERQLYKTIRP